MINTSTLFRKVKNSAHFMLGVGANIFYGFPAKKLVVIGVTGTDGKTTTSSLIYHILKQSGREVAMISTVGAFLGDSRQHLGFHVTTPSVIDLQRYIKKASVTSDNSKKYLVLEVTSHALDQHRVHGVGFAIGVLTNISHEHLDYHKTLENYMSAKLKLFKRSKISILNKDDASFEFMSTKLQGKKVYSYSLKNKDADFTLERFPFKTTLIGDFNYQNCMAAVAVAKVLSVEDAIIKDALESFIHPEGRQHIVHNKSFTVMIDFAHTPNAFEKILSELKTFYKKGRLIHVFGSAGKRDISKRPLMGASSSKYADVIILTEEDSRDENVEQIMSDIETGISKKFTYENSFNMEGNIQNVYAKIPNRTDAIQLAIKLAKQDDIVVVTGKGHESSINRGKGEEHWDEFEVTKQAIAAKLKKV